MVTEPFANAANVPSVTNVATLRIVVVITAPPAPLCAVILISTSRLSICVVIKTEFVKTGSSAYKPPACARFVNLAPTPTVTTSELRKMSKRVCTSSTSASVSPPTVTKPAARNVARTTLSPTRKLTYCRRVKLAPAAVIVAGPVMP